MESGIDSFWKEPIQNFIGIIAVIQGESLPCDSMTRINCLGVSILRKYRCMQVPSLSFGNLRKTDKVDLDIFIRPPRAAC